MSKDEAERGIKPLAEIKSWASRVDPSLMGTGPIPSSQKALEIAVGNLKTWTYTNK